MQLLISRYFDLAAGFECVQGQEILLFSKTVQTGIEGPHIFILRGYRSFFYRAKAAGTFN